MAQKEDRASLLYQVNSQILTYSFGGVNLNAFPCVHIPSIAIKREWSLHDLYISSTIVQVIQIFSIFIHELQVYIIMFVAKVSV